ncbi:hypothetical protein D5S17_06550 [Pseudonocardiaceae bacterium YIM PH 21723]|nr:hypothetical protein D5S17_06550 [Pseudonocardiaceae bacterium YIM PH 21723]
MDEFRVVDGRLFKVRRIRYFYDMPLHPTPVDDVIVDQQSLPSRPRILSGLTVLRRSADTLQLGIDPRHGVILGGLSAGLSDLVGLLDGTRDRDDLIDTDPQAHELLSVLFTAGVLEQERPIPARLRPDLANWSLRAQPGGMPSRAKTTLLVHGDGRIGIAVALLLAGAGVGHVRLRGSGMVRPEDVGCGYLDSDIGRPRETAAAEAITRLTPEVGTRPLTGSRTPDLVILTDHLVPDPLTVSRLMSDRIPHLTARSREGVGIVGPLVFPGSSSCLNCADLHRRDLDPEWGILAAQLSGRSLHTDVTTAQATAALAAGQALIALGRGRTPPASWNATLELDACAGTMVRRPWTPHSGCTCSAPQHR